MLYVDGVSSIASIDFRMDDWRVDLAVTGSQKGLMLPAGLGIVCASEKALASNKNARCARTRTVMKRARRSAIATMRSSAPMSIGGSPMDPQSMWQIEASPPYPLLTEA